MARQAGAARPQGTVEQIKTRGTQAAATAAKYSELLTGRLAAGLVEGMTTDLRTIGSVVPGALSSRTEKKAATGNERQLAAIVLDHVSSLRDLVKHAYPNDNAVLKAWGVGAKANKSTTKSVLAAGNLVVQRATERPEEARAAGILDADIATLNQELTALDAADGDQGNKGLSSKEATSVRDTTLRRIERSVRAIGLAGRQGARTDPSVRAEFEALLAPYGTAKAGAKTAAKTAAPAPA